MPFHAKRLAAFLLWMLPALLCAAPGFWEQVTQAETRYYAQNAETNASAAENVDAKFETFRSLVAALRADPYTVQNPQNVFFDPDQAQEALYKLKTKIRVNRDHGYTAAVTRDRIAVETLELRQRIFGFFAALSAEWTGLGKAALQQRLRAEQTALQQVNPDGYAQTAREERAQNGDIAAAMETNLAQLYEPYGFYKEFLEYLQLNPEMLHYRSLTQRLQLGSLIAAVNDNEIASQLNTMLRYVGLDLGRLGLFAAVLLLAWLIAGFAYFKLYKIMRALITRKYDATDEMMLSNIDTIRRPFFLLLMAFGLELGLEILRYPRTSESENSFFFFIYLATLSYILVVLIDNFFFHYLLKYTGLKTRQMRSELVNLILSIIKVVVFLSAGMIFLVHIGVNITGIIASLGIGGLAVALAAKDTLSNFFGLLKILSDNSFSQGDWIQAGDVEGTVVEIGFISTDIRTFDNALITVPNERLANVPLKNYNRRKVGRRIKMHVGVTYGSDREQLAKAIEAIRAMLLEHPDTVVPGEMDKVLYSRLQKRERRLISVEDKYGIKTNLMVYLDQLSASSMDILIYTFTNTVNWEEWLQIKQDIIFKIWEILDAHGLQFAFPSQSLYFDEDNLREAVAPVLKNTPEK